MIRVLFVCLGNICRSPTAQAVFEQRISHAGLRKKIAVDSAGTAAFHIGKTPDARAAHTAALRGYDLSRQTARQISPQDFVDFDFILPMDRMNLGNLNALKPQNFQGHLGLFMNFCRLQRQYSQVPDPYYEGDDGFNLVLDLVEDAADGLLEHIQKTRQ